MTKARDLADLISTGNPLADGAIAVAEVTGAAPLASPTFTGTATAPTINASTALQIGGTAITVGASDINTVTAKAPLASPTFTGDVTLPDKIVHTGDTNTAIRFPTDDTVAFETGGSERFRFGSSGQLGIGGATYGTSGQVLTSGGSGAAPTWADAGGGAYELITKTTISSNATEIIFDSVSAPQQQLLLLINGLQINNNGSILLHYRNSSGGNLDNTGGSSDMYRNTGHFSDSASSAEGWSGNNYGGGVFIGYSQTWPSKDFNASFRIFNFGTTATGLQGTSSQISSSGSTAFQSQDITSRAETSAATAGIRLYITNSREFTSGEVYLYKLV